MYIRHICVLHRDIFCTKESWFFWNHHSLEMLFVLQRCRRLWSRSVCSTATWSSLYLDLGRATREWGCSSFCLQSLQKVVKESGTPVKLNMEHNNSLEVWLEDHSSFLNHGWWFVGEPAVFNLRKGVPSYLPGNFLTYPQFEKALSGVDRVVSERSPSFGGEKSDDTQVDVPVAEAVQGSESLFGGHSAR